MVRTRAGLLDGALSVVERDGLDRLTMSAVANRSGVAKATLYNHFRTKDDVLRALVVREVELLADDADLAAGRARAAGADQRAATAAGLARAAGVAAEHVAGRRVATDDPGALAPLLRADGGPAWTLARARLAHMLGVPAEHSLVRLTASWLVGQLFDPADAQLQGSTAALISRAAVLARTVEALPAQAAGSGAGPEPGPEPGPGPG
jgi:AcrR family transcriptional regulator